MRGECEDSRIPLPLRRRARPARTNRKRRRTLANWAGCCKGDEEKRRGKKSKEECDSSGDTVRARRPASVQSAPRGPGQRGLEGSGWHIAEDEPDSAKGK